MEQYIPVEVYFDNELPVPTDWREAIFEISEMIRNGTFNFDEIDNVLPISSEDALYIRDIISAYGDTLVPLPNDTWNTSIYRASGSGWDVMVDLFTANEGLSDLVLFITVNKINSGYKYSVKSVHVP